MVMEQIGMDHLCPLASLGHHIADNVEGLMVKLFCRSQSGHPAAVSHPEYDAG